MADVEMDLDFLFREVMATKQVQAAVYAKATRAAALARREMTKRGIDGTVTIKDKYLPTGRYGLDVVIDSDDPRARSVDRFVRRAIR